MSDNPKIQALVTSLRLVFDRIKILIDEKADLDHTAIAAEKLENARTIAITGDASGSVSFDGSGDLNIITTLANTGVAPGTYMKLTVDGKGRITKGELLLAADIPALDAAKVTTGAFHVDRIPALPTSKVTGLDTALNSKLNAALYTAADVLAKLITVDGAGSGIDADALDGKQLATIESEYKAFCNAAIAALVDSSPEALNTLNELAAALGNDPNFTTTVATQLGTKVNGDDARLTNSREWTASTISQAEAEAGTATTRRAFTAQRVRQAIVAWWVASAEKTKLDGIATGATANSTDAQLRDRATHTGTQAIDTVSGLQTELDAKVALTDSRLTDAREWTGVTVTQAEAEAGTATTRRAWTAQRIRQAIAAWWAGSADKTKLDGIQAGAQVNVATNLGYTSAASNGTVTSSTGNNATLPAATTAAAGLMTAADKSKLDGIAAGATANSTDATLLNRANHTGAQAISTITNLQSSLNAKFNSTGGTVNGLVKANGYLDAVNVIQASKAQEILDIYNASVFDITLAVNTSIQLGNQFPPGFSPNETSISVVVRLRQGATPFTVNWVDNIEWLTPGGLVGTPPPAGKIKEFVFSSVNGINWIGREGASNI